MDPELRVEVAQRFVHEEHLRLSNEGAAQRDPLALPAAQLTRLPVHQGLDLKELRGPRDPLRDFLSREPRVLQRERHVLEHGHMRVQRVALEDHRDVSLLWVQAVHEPVSDVDLAFRDVLESGDAAKRGRLPATGGAQKHDELPVLDL